MTPGAVELADVEPRERGDATANGWYYDVDPAMGTPARVHHCPGVCERLKADPTAAVELPFGCESRVIR